MDIKQASRIYHLQAKDKEFRKKATTVTDMLLQELQSFDREYIAKKMTLKGELLEKTMQDIKDYDSNPFGNALLSFTGTVFHELDIKSYREEHFNYAHENIRILSAFYGSLCAMENIKSYRLDMNMNIFSKSLYKIWGDLLNEYYEDETILNLASNEYAKTMKCKMIDVDFLVNTKRVAYHSKVARGQMLDFIIKNMIVDIKPLKSVSFNGYKYSKELSSERKLVYTK